MKKTIRYMTIPDKEIIEKSVIDMNLYKINEKKYEKDTIKKNPENLLYEINYQKFEKEVEKKIENFEKSKFDNNSIFVKKVYNDNLSLKIDHKGYKKK